MLLDTNNIFTSEAVEGFNNILPKLPKAILALLFGLVLIRILSWVIRALISFVRLPKGLKTILFSLVDGLLWIFLIISVLQSLGLGNLALVFSGAVAATGLALGSGASSLASDILAGIFLAKDKDFNVGDEVIAGEKPTQGIIESMDMRRTRIRTKDGKLHIIPNSLVERKEWVLVSDNSGPKRK